METFKYKVRYPNLTAKNRKRTLNTLLRARKYAASQRTGLGAERTDICVQ